MTSSNPDPPTFGEIARDAGYRTLLVGKWHLNGAPPVERGFDRHFGFMGSGTDSFKGDDWLLDNSLVLDGSGTSHTHVTENDPLRLAGGKNMGFKHGAYHDFRRNGVGRPLNNLLLTLLRQSSIEIDLFGDSSGTLDSLLI